MNTQEKKAIKKVVDYLWNSEVKSYEEMYLDENYDEDTKVKKSHILFSLKVLKELVK